MRIAPLMTILAAPLALAACGSDPEATRTDDMSMPEEMPMAGSGGEMRMASAEGTVTAVDDEAGTITIDHGPVPSVNWPAMTMAFDADADLRQQVAVGDEVTFEFSVSDSGNRITSLGRE